MATSIDQQAIEMNLDAVTGTLADLPEFAKNPEDWGTWDGDWADTMARFAWLVRLADKGQLNPEQLARCKDALQTLARLMPLVDVWELYMPDELLDAIKEVS
jgi:hypothetical protein